MPRTRKVRRGGGMFNLLLGKPKNAPGPTASNLKAKRNVNLAHSKSRVANILGTPGQFKYTNKERIESEYQTAIAELKKLEKPQETASALRTLASQLETALQSETARKAGAITLTLPIGVAQLAFKAMMVFLAVLAAIFIDIPTMGSLHVSTTLLPNRGFNTTQSAYNWAKEKTGVSD